MEATLLDSIEIPTSAIFLMSEHQATITLLQTTITAQICEFPYLKKRSTTLYTSNLVRVLGSNQPPIQHFGTAN